MSEPPEPLAIELVAVRTVQGRVIVRARLGGQAGLCGLVEPAQLPALIDSLMGLGSRAADDCATAPPQG
jgi:hypothetical protein